MGAITTIQSGRWLLYYTTILRRAELDVMVLRFYLWVRAGFLLTPIVRRRLAQKLSGRCLAQARFGVYNPTVSYTSSRLQKNLHLALCLWYNPGDTLGRAHPGLRNSQASSTSAISTCLAFGGHPEDLVLSLEQRWSTTVITTSTIGMLYHTHS